MRSSSGGAPAVADNGRDASRKCDRVIAYPSRSPHDAAPSPSPLCARPARRRPQWRAHGDGHRESTGRLSQLTAHRQQPRCRPTRTRPATSARAQHASHISTTRPSTERDWRVPEPNVTCDYPLMRSRLFPVLSIFASGVVYAVLPRGMFGTYDVAGRAVIVGALAAVTCLLALRLTKRWSRG